MSAAAASLSPVMPSVVGMLKTPGIYFVGDSTAPGMVAVLVSVNGRIFSTQLDEELDPARFLPTMKLAGPFTSDVFEPQSACQQQ